MNPMLVHIHGLPELIRGVFSTYDNAVRRMLSTEFCRSLKRMVVTGCGDSHHVALGSELAFESLAGLPTEPMTAMQFARYAAGFLPESEISVTPIIGISVSGEVSRTVEALRLARQAGASTMALTATLGSRVANAASHVLPTTLPPLPEMPGIVPPGVRSYAANQLMLFLMAVRMGEARGRLTPAEADGCRRELLGLAEMAEETIAACNGATRELAEELSEAQEFVFVGAGPNYATALFSAAKLLEASGDSAIGQEIEEWAHLQYFARAVPTPTFFISAADRDLSRAVEVATAAQAIGRRVLVVAPSSASALTGLAPRRFR